MNKRVRTRFLIVLGVTVLSIALFAGFPPSVAKMKEKVHLGLDLRGGTHLVLQVVTDDAIRAETDQAITAARECDFPSTHPQPEQHLPGRGC